MDSSIFKQIIQRKNWFNLINKNLKNLLTIINQLTKKNKIK